MFIFESNLLETALCVGVVLLLLFCWLKVTIIMDFISSSWTFFTSVVPGENHAKMLVASTLTITMFICWVFSSTLMIFGILILSVHLLNFTVVTDSFKSGWNRFISVIPGSTPATIFVASTLTIMMFIFGSFSLAVLVFSVQILSVHLLNFTIVMDFFESGWKRVMSVSQRENLTKILERMTLRVKVFFFESSPLVRTFLIIVVSVLLLHWLNFTIVTDLFISGWNLFKSGIPGFGLVETFVESIMSMVFAFGSFSSTVLAISVLVISVHLLNLTVVTNFFKSGCHHFRSVSSRENLTKILEGTTLRVKMFFFESSPLVRTFLIIVVSVLLLHWLNFIIVTDLFRSGWNLFKSVVPGFGLVETFVESTVTITVFVFGSYSSSVLVVGVLIFSVHLLSITIVTDSFKSGWNHFISVIPGSDHAKIFGVSTLTITLFAVGLFSSTFVAIGVLILSVHLLNVTMVTNSFKSGWHHVRSVISVYIFKGSESKLLANAVIGKSTLLTPQTAPVPVYKIPLREKPININGCRYFSFGKKSTKPNRTIVVVGAADSGKSTVISGMINHILGVEWEDSYRFKVVHEAQSTHGEVTVYKIYHQEGFRIDHSLTIVDTPGFGDTSGVEQSREITEQLRNVFYSLHDVGEIDSVCFVAQAALTQLTAMQIDMFNSILSVFGKDVSENIRILVTSADGQLPPVLDAFRASGVPCPKTEDGLPVHFQFNNSALFADNTSDSRTNEHQAFWNMGTKSMMGFFEALICMKTIELTLTNEALGDRKQVESSVENLQKQVKLGLAKLEKIRETIEKLKDHEAEVNTNENFEFYVVVKKPFKVDISQTGHFITNCQQCQVTCHYPCGIPNDDGKKGCSAMGSNGYCQVCPGKCFWNVHFNQKFKWEYREFKEKQTVKELRENYDEAAEEKATGQSLIEELKAEYDDAQNEVMKVIDVSAKCLNRLKEIGLSPHSFSTLEYIDMLIEGEKKEAKPGWETRVGSLMEVREKAEKKAKC